MAGRGPAPKVERQNKYETPERGEYRAGESSGWKHGETPAAPEGLTDAAVLAWSTWMGAWFASFWSPADLPALRQLVRLYDRVELGEFQRAGELRLQMDTYGITPKGQQDRRWTAPIVKDAPVPSVSKGKSYGHLKSTG